MPEFPITLDWPGDIGRKMAVDIAKHEEIEEIGIFLGKHFFSVSPALHLISWDHGNPLDEKVQMENQQLVLDYLLRCLNSGPYSLVVREQTTSADYSPLIAVLICRIENKTDGKEEKKVLPDRLFFAITEALKKDVDLFALYQTDKIIQFSMMAVDKQYVHQGVGLQVLELAIARARESGAGAIKAEGINHVITRNFTKFGCTAHKTIDYATFEYKGVKPLSENKELLSEHPVATLVALRLQ